MTAPSTFGRPTIGHRHGGPAQGHAGIPQSVFLIDHAFNEKHKAKRSFLERVSRHAVHVSHRRVEEVARIVSLLLGVKLVGNDVLKFSFVRGPLVDLPKFVHALVEVRNPAQDLQELAPRQEDINVAVGAEVRREFVIEPRNARDHCPAIVSIRDTEPQALRQCF